VSGASPVPVGAAELADSLARAAGDLIRARSGPLPITDVGTKAHAADLLTPVDTEVEALVRSRIAEEFPRHRVCGEEFGESGPPDARHVWWIDPIDGTTNFAHGIPWYSFSLALTVDGEPVLGLVLDAARGEVLRAVEGESATVDGKSAAVSAATDLTGGVVLTEWLAHRPWQGMSRMLAGLTDVHCTARVMGSSALSLALVAAGRAAAAVIGTFSPIDDLAGAYIAVRAGADVISADGTLTPPDGGVAVAAPGVTEQLRALLPYDWAH
jgi:myo-inositol-1(or 4)-monophosphatase